MNLSPTQIIRALALGLIYLLLGTAAYSDVPDEDSSRTISKDQEITIAKEALESEPLVDSTIIVPLIDFRDTKIIDIISVLAKANNLNIWVDQNIEKTATVHFKNIRLNDFLEFLISEYSLTYEKQDGVLKIYKTEPPPPSPPVQEISYDRGKITVDVADLELAELARRLSAISGNNVMVEKDTQGRVSGYIRDADFESGLTGFLHSNGFRLAKRGGIYFIQAIDKKKIGDAQYIPGGVTIDDGLISLNVNDADLKSLIDEIANKAGLELVSYGEIQGMVSARCNLLSPEEVFRYILRGTGLTYLKSDDIYFIGSTTMSELAASKLIRLKHLMASSVLEMIPASLSSKATFKTIKEHNAIMAIGPVEAIDEIEEYIVKLDHPPAQILIEALVVDYTYTDHYEFGIRARSFGFGDSIRPGDTYYPDIDYEADSDILNERIQELADRLSITNVGRLPANFYLKLNALAREGKANIKSRPIIATLNGHEAKIDIGTTQYYLLSTETTYGVGQQTPTSQVTQRFETIEASMSLVITPWVNASDEIIVKIHPEFNTPQGLFDPDVPPTINHRVLDSNVRLRDGETIILGGLIQATENISEEKFPILGDIPILGWLFRNRTKMKINSELVIYLTPHIYYGSEGEVDISKYED